MIESTLGSSGAPSSSCSTPSASLVVNARVLKLEAQIPTLMHHILPLMQMFITEAEEQTKKKVAQQTKRRIQVVHQLINAFDLRVLARPTPILI